MAKKIDLKDLSIGGKKLSPRDFNYILVGIGLVALLASYFLGFTKLNEKNTALATELDTQTKYLSELKGYYDNLEKYERGTNEAKADIGQYLSRLPVGFEDEDFLLCLIKADETIGSKTSAVSFNSVEPTAEFKSYVGDKYRDVFGYRASATATMDLNYQQFKKYIEYIYDPSMDYTYIDSVSVTYNAETAKLSAVFNLSKYFIEYKDYKYVGEEGYDVALGKLNPFGSK